nr:EAL domain-containing protein [Sphingomonas sp. TREG-RG-20F-R18-01]
MESEVVGKVIRILTTLLAIPLSIGTARAIVPLLGTACVAYATSAAIPTDRQVTDLPFSCSRAPRPRNIRWTWLRIAPEQLRSLPRGWRLQVDQTRFDRVMLITVTQDGTVRHTTRSWSDLADIGTPGGVLTFPIADAGTSIRGMYLGFDKVDDLSLVRSITGMTSMEAARTRDRWLILMGLFSGTLLSAFAYNVMIDRGRRFPFQRWYLAWIKIALVYGLAWSNVGGVLFPGLVGPLVVCIDYILVGALVAAGGMFFLSLVEDRLLPRWLQLAGRCLAWTGLVVGLLGATKDLLFPAILMDRLLNFAVMASAIMAFMGIAYAIRRGSRVVWFYVIGWGPVIAIFALRVLRNLGLFPQGDALDIAMFAALAFEAIILSLATSDRFRALCNELELARQSREWGLIEAEKMRSAALTDPLTGLGNRAAFQNTLQGFVASGRDTPFTLFLIDIDHLKDVNDRLGHAAGDAMLCHIATRLAAVAAKGGAIAVRLGGDEFAIVAAEGEDQSTRIENELMLIQGAMWRHGEERRALSLSIGSARCPRDGREPDLLYRNADLALYQAKRLGRSLHHRYDAMLRTLLEVSTTFASDAEVAMQRQEFLLYLQPIVDLRDDSVIGYEGLLRWQHPKHGLLIPSQFADILVEERIGPRVQDHVLDIALRLLRDHGGDIRRLSVNFTSAQLSGPVAAKRVLARMAHFGVSPNALCIEVTEGVMLGRAADGVVGTLHALHDAGVRIALDDFGTGYASLSHLRQVPVDTIKIDRSFIAALERASDSAEEIVRAIIGLAHGLGKDVVAEGVENEAQMNILLELGCRYVQGYRFGRPNPWRGASPEPIAMSATGA